MRFSSGAVAGRLHRWLIRLLVGEELSPAEREVTESLKALKTLKVSGGRVSVEPSEVLEYPGYQEARQRSAALLKASKGHK